jgi:acyl-[acyl-carrier-protein]-phospholipid O-acyltransferase/long-chain-fatty-acid--[acyl-carrier-protein] ligase
VLGNTYFWFLGSLLFSTIVVYGPDVLHIGQTKTGYLNAMLAVGIGSMAAGWVSQNKIEYGLIPLGSIGMTCTGFALGMMRMAWRELPHCSGCLASGRDCLPFPSMR